MASVVTREPTVILRIDGDDLREFIDSIHFESEVNSIFTRMDSANASLRNSITIALEQLNIEHGMPPSSDSWVFGNIVEPALQSFSTNQLEQPVSQQIFLEGFKKLVESIITRLEEQPVIVAHGESTFDGSGIKRILSNKFELNKLLHMVWRDLPKDGNQNATREQLRVALDRIAASADLPPYGTICQADAIVDEVFRTVNANYRDMIHEDEFRNIMTGILESLMLRLEENPISLVSNSVVHEPMVSSSDLHHSSSSPSSSSSSSSP